MNIVEINGDIAQWNMSASYLKYKLQQASGDIEVKINSYGGDVFEGIAMFNMLREYSKNKGKVTTTNTSMCASIASLIYLAGDTRKAYENSTIMIHRAWSWNVGNAEDMEAQAKVLNGIDSVLANTYAKCMPNKKDEILDIMSKEGWYIGQDQLDGTGFVDEFIPDNNTRIELASARATYTAVTKEISARAEKDGVSHNFEEVKASIMQCNDGKCPMDKLSDKTLEASPTASVRQEQKNNQIGADMKFDREDLESTEQTFNALVANRDTMKNRFDTVNMKLETAETALEAKTDEVNALKADMETQLSEAEQAKIEAIETVKAEIATRVSEAITEGVDAEVAVAMINAETAEEASKLVISAKESDGAITKADDSKEESGLLAYAKANKGSIR